MPVAEIAKESRRRGKSDIRYWEQAVFQATYKSAGKTVHVPEWTAKIQHLGRRETFALGSSNKAASASRAKEIYLHLLSKGWDETLSKFKPKAATSNRSVTTVGEFIAAVKANASGRSRTIESYCRAFRTIVADIFGIDGGTAKYDYRNGGRQKWLERIEAIQLTEVTPAAVQKWKLQFIHRAGNDPLKVRSARVSVNSLMRQAKSLFTPAILNFTKVELPEKSPFAGISFEPRQSMRYRSNFVIEDVIRAAATELQPEQFKIFLLATMAGLRRNEIDKLEWLAFRWEWCYPKCLQKLKRRKPGRSGNPASLASVLLA